MYGTEVADLAMVSGIGVAVRRISGMKSLPWVDIHVLQEPHHVNEASNALEPELSSEQYGNVVASAEEMWRLWIAFFSELTQVFDQESSEQRMAASITQTLEEKYQQFGDLVCILP